MAANSIRVNAWFACSALILSLIAVQQVRAAAPPEDPCDVTPIMEGCPIVNPATGEEETIYLLPDDPAVPIVITRVITGTDSVFHAVWTSVPTVGMQFPDPADTNNPPRTLVVTEVLANADPDLDHLFDRAVVRDLTDVGDDENPPVTWEISLVQDTTDIYAPGAPGIEPSPPNEGNPADANGNFNLVKDRRYGSNGSDGKDGGGLRVCIIWCFTIGVDPTPGGTGFAAPDFSKTVNGSAPVTSITADTPGVWVSSQGGNGGQGGDAYSVAGVDAAHGGPAGPGGNFTLTVTDAVTIITEGNWSHGIFAQSIAGRGGSGGSGYALFTGSGGAGGPAAQGGTVVASNAGDIQTQGIGAVGLYVQSLGGGGGSGGSGWGIVGDAGTASVGGHGGSATAINSGSIETWGLAAHGVVAQSVGGNGGDGGRAGGIVAVGGSGSGGGNGGNATARNLAGGSITTHGDRAFGMLVQSVGGGGGNGGSAGGIGAIGGGGSSGGIGRPVEASNNGDITTFGTQSYGIVAQSIGGGGGTGASSGGLVSIGGQGGTGGMGGTVSVDNQLLGTITTWNTAATGVIAQSIGGGGGAGGGGTGGAAIGGDGGGAGQGSAVQVTNAGRIETHGLDAKGIVAQSIGGGGGSGAGTSGAISVGGKAGGGGSGNTVNVTNSGAIETWGQGGDAIIAQSIGGGGGDGGSAGGLISLGGKGGNGGSANVVTVTNSGDIYTDGALARGILAQSIGGGGGNGGNGDALLAGIGGSGTQAGHANAVNVTSTGTIRTFGERSSAIEAQSIGGGGGSGGSSSSALFALGGKGSGGGNGSTVNVALGNSLLTRGDDSHGVLAQSIGGGGGSGGSAVTAGVFGISVGSEGGAGGTGGNVNIALQGADTQISTAGARSSGIFAQSVGGSGGNGGGAVSVTGGIGGSASIGIGGDAGSGNTAGIVTMTSTSTADTSIHTEADDATGVFLQSVGGSGGNGGYAVAVSASTTASISVAVGGEGGSGGRGGEVRVGTFSGDTLTAAGFRGDITTEGDRSTGLLAQSVGGGGGNGGFALSAAASVDPVLSGSLALGIGGDGGTGGTGDAVSVGIGGNITTQGAQSTGLLAQSVGGGGGNGGGTVSLAMSAGGVGGAAISVGIGGDGASGGHGGAVRLVTTDGTVRTGGENSSGIVAQSVGGGGGNGGYSINASGAAGGGFGVGVSVGLGGDGGGGGAGSAVRADLASNVITAGQNSTGVLAQSIGGGGGNGGFNISGSFAGAGGVAAAVSVGLGGDGASGGNAGAVNVTSSGNTIATAGDRSAGFVAQSIGGGGGNGGFNVSGTLAGGGGGAGAASIGLGGPGGAGGTGNTVEATVHSNVSTGLVDGSGNVISGHDSTGVLVQSVGGGGGNGGFNVSGSFSAAGAGSAAIGVGLGGSGGAGSTGGNVTANSTGTIVTAGDRAGGYVVQSIGGGGGNGGSNVTAQVTVAGIGSGAIGVGLGGDGAGGGDGGNVRADKSGDIHTLGAQSTGMLVQSVGGGGGNGGGTVDVSLAGAGIGTGAIGVSLGGAGGTGGDGGVVTAETQQGVVTTEGDGASGIVVQSIGGGGGNGGYAVQVGAAVGGIGAGAINVGLGGSGGAGGDGGATEAGLRSNVQTRGDDATGVLVQSVGGGGGSGGFSVTANVGIGGIGSGAVAVGLGGSGGTGGASGNVRATSEGTISTFGNRSSGFVAQSIGGGGGNGGFNVTVSGNGSGVGGGAVNVGLGGNGGAGGDVGTVWAHTSGDVHTRGAMSTGILAQSVGGGGGSGGFNVNVAASASGVGSGAIGVGLGGNGAAGAHGDEVDLIVDNDVLTEGSDSDAIVAQSIGGGGGNGGFNVTVGASASGVGGGSVSVGLGGKGSGGGDGARVASTVTGNVVTLGAGSTGVLTQSVGGGGGNGGFNVAAVLNVAAVGGGGASVGLGGSGGDGGDGGPVQSMITGDVYTAGMDSGGVVAQSLGGGGGNGGINVSGAIDASGTGGAAVSVGLGGSGGGGGDGLAAEAEVNGNVGTLGARSTAVTAQSLGGGGGNGALNVSGALSLSGSGGGSVAVGLGGSGGEGGRSDAATARVTGDVGTTGDDSGGVLAQSVGGGGGAGGINVSAGVTLTGGGGAAVAVGLGGSGGEGGRSGAALAEVTGNVGTSGNRANAVTAQSVGGGGGAGGLNVAGGLTASGSAGGSIAVGLGGSGGTGGVAAEATASVTGDVQTEGEESSGVVAQSIGGGGGSGGINVSGTVNLSGSAGAAVSVGLGGSGGDGGTADVASASLTGNVATAGAGSTGVVAQSIGGGGGNGGINISGALSASSSSGGGIGVGVGGFGGTGGVAGTARATVNGNVAAQGDDAGGVLVQSLGGGGGNGGINVSGVVTLSGSSGGALSVGVGGFGGSGGNAGWADAEIHGNVSTAGADSHAVTVQSIGGGGGNGGINVSGALTASQSASGSIGVGVGGFGGGGADGGAVTGVINGELRTMGDGSYGLLAQSLGGGGGNGGLNVSGALNLSTGTSVGAALGVGGFGGGGGDGSYLEVVREGTTITSGANAHGIVAQSLGGGGGNGGLNVSGGIAGSSSGSAYSGALGVGGFGGSGGRSGNVALMVTGDVLASGLATDAWRTEDGITRRVREGGSSGVLAQSIGGGGGNGGLNVSGGIALTPPGGSGNSNALSLGVGGFGGDGGSAGIVNLSLMAELVTAIGDGQFGVAAQSIGGGGGNGGVNVSGGISMGGQLTAGVGGFAGNGGAAGNVFADVAADIVVTGADAVGFLAESIGGGGGNGGINVSGGLRPTTTSSSQPSLVFGLGGFGGSGNVSGNVEATQSGRIDVAGTGSTGVLAQSIAGGGGNGGLNVAGSFALARKSNGAAIGIGGFGGAGADAGSVTLISDGEILVDGRAYDGTLATLTEAEIEAMSVRERGAGILAQSIGGGGGNGGINASGVLAPSGNQLAVGVGGWGGGGGHAGAVSVQRGQATADRILTAGNFVSGLAAQSIGGGGGNAGINIVFEAAVAGAGSGGGGGANSSNQAIIAIGGDGGDPGNGAAVDVAHAGEILTTGNSSHGLIAQSIGGGGGNANINFGKGLNRSGNGFTLAVGGAGANGGDGDAVTVGHAGAITTWGDDASAIFAQSIGGGGGNAEADDSAVGDYLDVAELAAQGFSDTKKSVEIEIGRSGGIGGDGRDVAVNSDGALATHGARAVGIRAQSIGAGGGVSTATSVGIEASDVAVSVQVGVGGASGGRAGAVSLTADGSIATQGADAHAIHAQSVGGGGGAGGSVSGSLLPSGNSVSVGVGGVGGDGGVAGTVSVANAADLSTRGDGAYGIHAQSIGGGGGDGGYAGVGEDELYEGAVDFVKNAIDGSLTEGGIQVSALVGGNGGTGALADAVTVGNSGTILTVGREAHGINAQSIGGGGGVGGMVMAGTVTMGAGNNSLGINVGGQGGDGSGAGVVSVTNEGVVWTRGDESVGVRAQSVGGGGGDAGLVAALNVTPIPGSGQMSASVNIGGNGGTGASSGDVTVTNRQGADGTGGAILTEGASSHAIFAQSLGGGGGNGSSVVQLNVTTDVAGLTAGLSIGGRGGDGGSSGNVEVTNAAQIETLGAGAHGVFAQSIGGGGGNGGLSIAGNVGIAAPGTAPMLAVGGEGGTGSAAGHVTVTNSGTILTRGENANGIFAQSIGGGGGNAGMGIPVSTDIASVAVAGTLSALLGGRGGDGGPGGNVTVNHSGDITVLGNGSQAVVAESINGGGGGIALDFNGITSLPGGSGLPDWFSGTETDPVFVLDIGGEDQQGAGAGTVTLNYTGTFGVAGDNGAASRVQAIGGGGGTFNFNLGMVDEDTAPGDLARVQGRLGGTNGSANHGGDIDSGHQGDLVTEGANTPGVLAQSVGGGGGRANVVVASESGSFGASSFALGGSNGSDERGGNVTHAQEGSIWTTGAASHGAVLQSVGGGGGLLSFVVGQAGEPEVTPAAAGEAAGSQMIPVDRLERAHAVTPKLPAQSAPLSLSLGGSGGSGLDGGDIGLGLDGDVTTEGDHAIGLVFQSIGAGGGIANVVGASSLQVAIGGAAGATGNGGALDISNTGSVSTTGAGAHGVLLQSIGGGGGAVISGVTDTTVTVSAANAGDGGAIRFIQTGDIRTGGAAAYGLFAQSLGGGGGLVDGVFAGSAGGAGAGGAIDLEIDGNLLALGEGSTALFAQSTGADGGGDIEARLTADRRIVAGVGGIAVSFDGGAANHFDNSGMVYTLDGTIGTAFRGGAGGDVVLNRGLMAGNVDMGGGANALTNAAQGTLYSSSTLSLGAASNLFTNEGLLAPGAQGTAVATSLSGSFRQAAGAVSDFELDFASDVLDSVLATGTAEVGGTVNVSLLNLHLIPSGHFVKPLFAGTAGLSDTGLAFNPQRSAVIDYKLVVGPTAAEMDYTVDFSPPGVKGNRNAIGDWFNRVQAAGSTPALANLITTLVLEPDLDAYADMLTQLGPELYAEQQAYTLRSGQAFGRSLRNCGWQNMGRISSEIPSCAWTRVDIDSTDHDSGAGTPATRETLRRFAWGYQFAFEEGFTFGLGFAIDDSSARGYDGRWSGGSKQLQLGTSLRRGFGDWSVGGHMTFGKSSQDARRALAVTDGREASGNRNVNFTTLQVDASRRFDWRGLVVTPGIGLGGALLGGGGMTESGGDEQSLVLHGYTDYHFWVEPTVNLGHEREVGRGRLLRTYARLGMLGYLNGSDTEVRASLAGGPGAVAPMRVRSDLDSAQLLAEGGVEYITANGLSLGLSYAAQRADLRSSGNLGLRFAMSLF